MSKVLALASVALSLLLFVACATRAGGPGDVRPGSDGSPSPEPTVPPDARPSVAAAKKDLAARTGKAEEQLLVVLVEAVEWRDSSLGCPETGKFYAQVITPGYRIKLSDGAREYEYHSDTRGHVVACEGGR